MQKIQKGCLSFLLEISDLRDHASAPEIRSAVSTILGGIKACSRWQLEESMESAS